MMHRMAATTAACLVLFCSQVIAAQGTRAGESSTEVGVSAGVGQSMRRDLSASPLDFAGHGGDIGATLRHVAGLSTIELTLNGGQRSLQSSSTASRATESVGQGQLSLALFRAVDGRSDCACGVAIGAALSANMIATQHAYDDPTHRSSNFLFGSAGIGPAASWRVPVAGGFFDARLNVPLASVVGHSYSVINEHDAATNWRPAMPNALRSATTTLAFTSAAKGRVGFTWRYRAEALRYDDVQPVRALTHSLSVGIVTRFGATGRTP
jgi:hypothetical protein